MSRKRRKRVPNEGVTVPWISGYSVAWATFPGPRDRGWAAPAVPSTGGCSALCLPGDEQLQAPSGLEK